MAADDEYILNGIKFNSATEYQNAKKELEGIEYITEKNDMSDDNVVFAIYNKFVQKNVFHTQIGYRFLMELQERLMRSDVIDRSKVAKLPIYDFEETEKAPENVVRKEPVIEKRFVEKPAEEKKMPAASNVKHIEKSAVKNNVKSSIHTEYISKQAKPAEADRKLAELKHKYGWSLFINAVLILVIIAMAYITLNSDNINILNYEERLQDEYAAWAQELAAKERELNRLEKELNDLLGN